MTLPRCRFLTFTFLIVSATAAFGEPKWGSIQDSLQLGIEWPTQSASTLQVLLRNVGSESRKILVGLDGAAGPAYNVKITAVRDQQPAEQLVFDLNLLKMQVKSLPVMKSVHLAPGEVYVFTYPLQQLICVVERQDTPVQTLLKQGYSLRASFEIPTAQLVTPELAARDI